MVSDDIQVRVGVDPRYFQIGFLAAFLLFGVWGRDFNLDWRSVAAVALSGLLVQGGAILLFGLAGKSLLSAAITGLSLCLLCRAPSASWMALAMVLSLGSKFVFRWKGKHFFNPTCFGIVSLLLLTGKVWISPGQWGDDLLLSFWVLILGATVVRRSERGDISWGFLVAFGALLFARVWYLGQSWAVWPHQMRSGSLLIFCFFMISDPRSTPDHRMGRLLFAGFVAAAAYAIRFWLYNPNALLLALFFLSPVTLFLDTFLKHSRYHWERESVYANLSSAVTAAPSLA